MTNYFIDSIFEADTDEEFQKIRDEEVQQTASYTFLQPPVDDTSLLSAEAGYQPFEYLQGARQKIDNGVLLSVFRDGNKVSFNHAGIFGHCETNTPSLFMQDLEVDTCVVTHKPMTAESCVAVDFNQIALL